MAVFFGFAEPTIEPEQIPGGGAGAFVIIIGLVLSGMFVVDRLQRRSWQKAGRTLGLEPEDGFNLFGMPALTGTVHGRPVRVDTYKIKGGGGGEHGNNSTTYTLVEAKLNDAVDPGFMIGHQSGDANQIEDDLPDELQQIRVEGEYYAFGHISSDKATSLLTTQVRDAYQDPAGAGTVIVGDPTDSIMAAVPESDGSIFVTHLSEDVLWNKEEFNPLTSSHSRKGLILNPTELDKQLRAVTSLADAYERVAQEAQTA